MKTLNTIANWIVFSSKNPTESSLTVKGILVGAIPTIMVLVDLAHLNLGSDQLSLIFDAVASFIQGALTVISTALTLFGLLRKLLNTIKLHQAVVAPNTTLN